MEMRNSKRIKKNNGQDKKISSLPEELLALVTSSLPFKEAVRNSVLAKKWQNLWPYTGNVELDEKLFVKTVEESNESRENHRRDFIEFSKKWCQSAKQDIHSFRLVFSNPGNYIADLQDFVKYAIDHNVKNLELDFSDPSWDENSLVNQEPVFELPKFVYQHSGLESIKLYSCKVNVFEFKNPGGIKSFSLGWTNLPKNRLHQFLAKCPLLEELSLKKVLERRGVSISAPSLKSLVLDTCSDFNGGIDIYAEKLKYFKYSGELIYFTFDYFSTLEVAEIDFSNEDTLCENADFLYNLLNELWSGKVLTVCSYLLQFIADAEESPDLGCVRHLIMKAGLQKQEYDGISYMLKSCPKLETLTFDMCQPRMFQDLATSFGFEDHLFSLGSKYDAYGPLFGCLKSSLKVVEIKGFKGERYETMAIKYFIRHSRVLEKVHIILSKEKGSNGMDMSSMYLFKANALRTCPKASPVLKFVIEN